MFMLCFALQVPEGLELAVTKMCAEEHALITITDAALAAAPDGKNERRTCHYHTSMTLAPIR
jgi:hypothetical protein